MALDTNKKFENKPLTEYRRKVCRTKWFLNRYFTPYWLQKPTKTSLIVSLVFWISGIALGLYVKNFHTDDPGRSGYSFIDLLLLTFTISMAGMCLHYYVSQRRKS